MRKVAILLSVTAAALMIASGVALAKNFQGDGKDNKLAGTSNNDTIAGSGGDDKISGKGGRDRLYGDSGADKVSGNKDPDDVFGGKGADDLFGNGGDDYINSADNRGGDFVDCGPGTDTAVIDNVTLLAAGSAEASLAVDFGIDDFQNCEDVPPVLTNPDTGTDSGDIENLRRGEVDEAIEAGILGEIE